mgnify:CR=1 FL=1
MNPTKKLAWLWIVFTISACQALPLGVPLATEAPTNTPGPTPTNTPLPTPTPLPTMEPVVRIDTGDQALFFGDYDLAREQYHAAFNDTTDDAIKAAALWGSISGPLKTNQSRDDERRSSAESRHANPPCMDQ